MIRFFCPSCAKILKAPPDAAGQKVACSGCGQRLLIPSPVRNKTIFGKLEPAPDFRQQPSGHAPPPRADAWGRVGKALTLAATVLVVLGFAAAGMWLGIRDQSPPKGGDDSRAGRRSEPLALEFPVRSVPRSEDPEKGPRDRGSAGAASAAASMNWQENFLTFIFRTCQN
jgi:hypothetical protein